MLVVVVYLILLVPRTYEWIVRSPNRLSMSGIICSHGNKTQVNCVTSHAAGHISPQQQAGHDGIITIKSDALSSGFHRSAMHMGRAPHAASLIMIIIITMKHIAHPISISRRWKPRTQTILCTWNSLDLLLTRLVLPAQVVPHACVTIARKLGRTFHGSGSGIAKMQLRVVMKSDSSIRPDFYAVARSPSTFACTKHLPLA